MKQLSVREIEQHVTILGWLYIIGHAVFLIVAGFLFMLLTGIGAAVRDPEALMILSIVGSSLAMLLSLLAIPGLVAGYGLIKRKTWGRVLAIVVGILGLVNVPIGTIIGLYTFWVLMQETATDYFMAPAPA